MVGNGISGNNNISDNKDISGNNAIIGSNDTIGNKDIIGNNSIDSSFRFTRVNSTTVAMKVMSDDLVDSKIRRKRSPMLPEILLEHDRQSKQTSQQFENLQDSDMKLQGHRMVKLEHGLLIFGGKRDSGDLSSDLWLFNFTSETWQRKAEASLVKPTPVWLHTFTLANDHAYVFGGSTEGGRIISDLFRINVHLLEDWEKVEVKGEKELELRMTAHSTVFHPKSNSLIAFGGIHTDVARFSKLSRKMFIFNLKHSVWSEVKYTKHEKAFPPEMAFHTANLVGNYMIVFGGYVHHHGHTDSQRPPLETCYSPGLHLYSLDCHCWQSRAEEHKPPGHAYPKAQGVFGHSAVVRHSSQLIIVGGYHGTVTGDLLGYTVPDTIARLQTPCQIYGSMAACMANPKCRWCGSNGTCHRNTDDQEEGSKPGRDCKIAWQASGCPKICASLSSCLSCTVHGNGDCMWCARTATCKRVQGNAQCLRPRDSEGWWQQIAREEDPCTDCDPVLQPQDCASADVRPGLTFSQYLSPANMDQPDLVKIVNSSKVSFKYPERRSEEIKTLGTFSVHLQGTIRPPNIKDKKVKQLEACVKFANASLTITAHTLSSQLTLSHPLPAGPSLYPSCEDTAWMDGQAIFLIPTYSYSLHFQADLNPSAVHSKQLSWLVLKDKAVPLSINIDRLKTLEQSSLEPYRNGTCDGQSCLACARDSSCGWCGSRSTCLPRSEESCPVFLTTEPELCTSCSDLIYCSDCVGNPACEWLAGESRCLRRGRVQGAITVPSSCPTPCHTRSSCSSCLDEAGRCVWCRATQQCFLFSVYTTEFQFGQCQQWLDRPQDIGLATSVSELCHPCSSHTTCNSCLADLGCGWCYDQQNPSIGSCTQGEPLSSEGQCQVGQKWEYFTCPDIDECRLGLHKCHVNASCVNLPGSYDCQCNSGFKGDGRTYCNKTCSVQCQHGKCSGAPDYVCICDLGWTGNDCGEDCGCHGHSRCSEGVGSCDECQHLTRGESCQDCQEGSFGDAKKAACQPCQCNGHENMDAGSCDPITGRCFCKHFTEGHNCELCKDGFHGDPRNNGTCMFSCTGKNFISEVKEGSLGLQRTDTGGLVECLWVISAEVGLAKNSAPDTIRLRLQAGNDIDCRRNSLFVYDGLPPSIASPGEAGQLISSLCGHSTRSTREMTATSGRLSIIFVDSSPTSSFNASFLIGGEVVEDVEDCPKDCPKPLCAARLCRLHCPPGLTGPTCSTKVLPDSDIIRKDVRPADAAKEMFARMGHTMVVDSVGWIWMFGGLNQNREALQDLRVFHPSNFSFRAVPLSSHQTQSQPSARFFHAATFAPLTNSMYIMGGTNGHFHLSDFWRLDLVKFEWTLLETFINPSWVSDDTDNWEKFQKLPSLAGHTLTYCPNTKSLILIGGHSTESGYNPEVLEYDLLQKRWQKVTTNGFGPRGIFGHSTIYNDRTRSLHVFGGHVFNINESFISNKMWTLESQSMTWSLMPFDLQHSKALYHLENRISPRFLHTAVAKDDYMVILGGDSHMAGLSVLLVFSFSCNQWLRIPTMVTREVRTHMRWQGQFIGKGLETSQGAAAVLTEDGRLLISGGLSQGRLEENLISISLPKDLCRLFDSSYEDCLSVPGCAMCREIQSGASGMQGHCIFAENATDLVERCPGPRHKQASSWWCARNWISQENRDCGSYNSCGECLATFPQVGQNNIIILIIIIIIITTSGREERSVCASSALPMVRGLRPGRPLHPAGPGVQQDDPLLQSSGGNLPFQPMSGVGCLLRP